ncbi:DEP domain-containing protein 7-like [Menidia menidia]
MASIRERAAALNLEEKLCVRPPAPGGSSRPAQSSSLWSGLISHLRTALPGRRRLVLLRAHGGCFPGSEAVDAVAQHVAQAKGFEGACVSRARAESVCGALLEAGVFEPVGTGVFGRGKKRDAFSRSALYRFGAGRTPSVEELESGALRDGIQKLFCSPPDGPEKPVCPTEPRVQMPTPVREPESRPEVRPEALLAVPLEARLNASLTLQPLAGSLSPSRAKTDSALPQSVVEEVWREQTLQRLLSLVELPLLEDVLHCVHSPPSAANQEASGDPALICVDRQIIKAFRSSQEDEWLCAALDCLDFLPDQPVVELSRELPHCFPPEGGGGHPEPAGGGLPQCQRLLFGALAKHYSSRPPLLPRNMADVYTAITGLLVKARLDAALEALQLSLKLLAGGRRQELHRLLAFMALAADAQAVRVDREMENRLAVKKSFSRAVLPSKSFSKEKEDLMLVFMLSNIKEIFKIPAALHKAVSEKLAGLAQAKQPDVTGSNMTQQAGNRTYDDAAKETTNRELWILLNSIHLDTEVSAKERKRRLRQFYQSHPEIFNRYFGDSALSEL